MRLSNMNGKGEKMKIVKCVICGQTFETNRPNKKYCSFTCKEAGAQLLRMKWEDKNPDYYKNYMQKYRAERWG